MDIETAKKIALEHFPKAYDYSSKGEFALYGLVVDFPDSTPEDPHFFFLIIYDEKDGLKNAAWDNTQTPDAPDDAFWPSVESMTEEKWRESLISISKNVFL